jgi:hypothetical protein
VETSDRSDRDLRARHTCRRRSPSNERPDDRSDSDCYGSASRSPGETPRQLRRRR